MQSVIYLDNNGTTPVDPAVAEAALPYLREHFGNPSTRSPYGQAARAGLDRAREQVAAALGAHPDEIVFTSGATESNNWVVAGAVLAARGNELPHLVTTAVEHPSIGNSCSAQVRRGMARVSRVPVDGTGRVSPEVVLDAVLLDTCLVSVMHANNEVGTLQPVAEVAAAARERGILVHTDAAQSLGKVPVRVGELGVDLLSVAGHKLYAPKGIGALYIRRGVELEPLLHGAGHESGRRSGTENVALAVALGAAMELAAARVGEEGPRLSRLRDRLHANLTAALGSAVVLNGHPELRLPNTLSVNFLGVTGAELLAACPGLAASTGPACHDGQIKLSFVLQAMGVRPEVGRGAVRLSLGRFTTEEQVEEASRQLIAAYRALVPAGARSGS